MCGREIKLEATNSNALTKNVSCQIYKWKSLRIWIYYIYGLIMLSLQCFRTYTTWWISIASISLNLKVIKIPLFIQNTYSAERHPMNINTDEVAGEIVSRTANRLPRKTLCLSRTSGIMAGHCNYRSFELHWRYYIYLIDIIVFIIKLYCI